MLTYNIQFFGGRGSSSGGGGGLGHSPVVVLKKDGKVVDMITFINAGTGKEIGRKNI